jgi:transposase
MSDGLLKAVDLLTRMAETTALTMDKVASVLRLEWSDNAAQQAERRSSPAEKDIIETRMQELFNDNPAHFDEVSPKEIAKEIGVRVNQGNRSRIRHKVKQLQLTYQKAAE